ncbi:hypothetical protein [Saccharopolyspora hattusasensis]|uniref:hypothetical protein n=1 Tax=Saccharopolyspora hattusasensis TaxID=1128679 RepID=UPI003D97FECD
MSITRDELHRLLDQIEPDELEQVGDYVRHLVERRKDLTEQRRHLRSQGAFPAEPELSMELKDYRRVSESGEGQQPRRVFRFAGLGEGPSDLGARAKEIAREELGRGRHAQ